MHELKKYQKDTLDVLTRFLTEARFGLPSEAYLKIKQEQGIATRYETYGLGSIPYACLRLPTGGGKTLLAAHTINIASKNYLEKEFPLVLWLVPTNAIRNQTLKALQSKDNSYRQVIDEHFNGKVSVFDIGDVDNIRTQDIENTVCIVVGTLATLRVEDKTGRKIYASRPDWFDSHFKKIPDNYPGLDKDSENKVIQSFANLCHFHKPLVIMDEAHNARTSLTFETLKRVSPACIVEFTATPNTTDENGSNILYSVTASELKAENMIKLPIMLTEHKNWQNALHETVIMLNKLSELAKNENEYIRPMALIQAESKNHEVTVDIIKQYLIEEEKITANKVAIATGTQREIDGIDLFDPKCKIEYIITIEALKEGWDCSFAYVFCSVANIGSSTDVEQILGRVLRMPYAVKRKVPELNYAYAYVISERFLEAANNLKDKLINMGFEELEADAYLKPKLFFGDDLPENKKNISFIIESPVKADTTKLLDEVKKQIDIKVNEKGTIIKLECAITDTMQTNIASLFSKDKNEQNRIVNSLHLFKAQQDVSLSPAEKGKIFKVPQLSVFYQGYFELPEPSLFLESSQWNILDYSAELSESEFNLSQEARAYKFDIENKKIVYETAEHPEFEVDNLHSNWDKFQLVIWFDKQLQQVDVPQIKMIEYIRKVVEHLLDTRKLPIDAVVIGRYLLKREIEKKIKMSREAAMKRGFQDLLFSNNSKMEVDFKYSMQFDPNNYPVHDNYYQGAYRFKKHFYVNIGDLKSDGEEFECAQIIDTLGEVDYWVKNLPRQPEFSFWLPTSTDKFYPDFMIQLKDGRILAVEYKGGQLTGSDDTKEKDNIGRLWESKSNGKCLFLIVYKTDDKGRDITTQIKNKVKK
ncbi:MAG: DEAD/DEAH box helicase family protein [Elusimicrobia bacterium]|nr:DEAD/DEAH box helicase family protein [Candidatus Liberimonas magnetica]